MSRAQFNLWSEAESDQDDYEIFRPVHYLGSKLRVLPSIKSIVDDLVPRGTHIVDLFAGSGTVSRALAEHRRVTAVDIQEYSRVLCSVLLGHWRPDLSDTAHFEDAIAEAEGDAGPFSALIDYERYAIHQYREGNAEPLSDLIENGSLEAFRRNRGSFEGAERLRRAHEDVVDALASRGSVSDSSTSVTRHFGGVYFSYAQSALLDAALEFAVRLEGSGRDFFTSVAMSVASDLTNTIGKQFAQPIQTRAKDGTFKGHNLRRVAAERARHAGDLLRRWFSRYSGLRRPLISGAAVRADYLDFWESFNETADAVYADPPYTRDHYSRYYHVLETMAVRDNPRLSDMVSRGVRRVSRGLYRSDRHQSPFSIVSQAPGAFEALFSQVRMRRIPLILSYSPFGENRATRPRVVTIQAITEAARRHFRHVDVQEATNVAHNKLNVGRLNSPVTYQAEVLIICRP